MEASPRDLEPGLTSGACDLGSRPGPRAQKGPVLGSAGCCRHPPEIPILQAHGALRFHFAFICIPAAYVAGLTSRRLDSEIPRR